MTAFELADNGCLGRVLLCGETFATPEVRASLERLGYQVAGEAADTEGAVRTARALRPEIILIDGDFPPHGAVGTTRRIARECPTVIIIARASGDPQWVQRAMEAGASGYLTLPLRLDDLGPALLLASSHFNQLRLYERLATEMREANERLLISGLREQQYATQLRKLADITAEIHSAPSLQTLLQLTADRSRELLGSEMAGINFAGSSGSARAFSVSSNYPVGLAAELAPRLAALCSAASGRDAVRIPAGETARHLQAAGTLAAVHGEYRGALAACLQGPEGEAAGVLWLVDRSDDDFAEEDEAILRQVAQVTSLALSKKHLSR